MGPVREETAVAPEWAVWNASRPYTVGLEEELMLLEPADWSLSQSIDEVLPQLSSELRAHITPETHRAAIELASRPHDDAYGAAAELAGLRGQLARELMPLGKAVAGAGTHPCAVWTETEISSDRRYQLVYESMRELARREPTFAVHVHVGVAGPEQAVSLQNALRAHIPLFLALSANSPYWQGRDTGLSSARTPLFNAFPRTGIPRAFASYAEWTEAVDLLLRCDAFPEPTFLWWDVRLQPRFGTVEVRVMDAQITAGETALLAALVQVVARLEIEEGYVSAAEVEASELLDENRFLAARDGMRSWQLDPVAERRVPAIALLRRLGAAARDHARDLGCEPALDVLLERAERTGAAYQRDLVGRGASLPELVERMAGAFLA